MIGQRSSSLLVCAKFNTGKSFFFALWKFGAGVEGRKDPLDPLDTLDPLDPGPV